MDVVERVKKLKEVETKTIIFVKIGSFYNVYEEDCFILSYLFGYKIKLENNYRICGFQITSSNKVFSKLKESNINYLIIDKRLNYEMTEKIDFKRKNQYKNLLKISTPYINLKEKLEILCKNILENIDTKNYKSELENIELFEEVLNKKSLKV